MLKALSCCKSCFIPADIITHMYWEIFFTKFILPALTAEGALSHYVYFISAFSMNNGYASLVSVGHLCYHPV